MQVPYKRCSVHILVFAHQVRHEVGAYWMCQSTKVLVKVDTLPDVCISHKEDSSIVLMQSDHMANIEPCPCIEGAIVPLDRSDPCRSRNIRVLGCHAQSLED